MNRTGKSFTSTGMREASQGSIAIVAPAAQYAVKHECNNAISPLAVDKWTKGNGGIPDIYGVSR